MPGKEKQLFILMITVLAGFAAAGFIEQGFTASLKGVILLQSHPARLLNDYTLAGGTGAALVNSAIVGAVGLFLVRLNRIRISGPTIAAVFTMMGFGFFGKTISNSLPIIIGVYFSSKIISRSFREYILIALFGTALGPIVTLVMYELGITGPQAIELGIVVGLLIGIMLPSIAIKMLQLHQGYNLYNMGLTCGFIALFGAAFLSAAGFTFTAQSLWNSEPSPLLECIIPVLSLYLLLCGVVMGKRDSLRDLIMIQSFPGRLPSDFMEMASISGALINMGLLGLAGSLYVFLTGSDFSGPVLGGLLTMIGFGAFGKNIKNCAPVIAGVLIACLVFGKNPSAPGVVLAALFGTTLAPIAGEFGSLAGLAAGFIHLTIVERTGAWHGGLDLYNNGFAGGLTAALLMSVIEWYRSNIKKSNT